MTSRTEISRVFLSYNKNDRDYAAELAAALEVVGVSVWFDQWSVKLGDSIPAAIDRGLRGFDCFVLIWSAHAAASGWVRGEMEAALSRVLSTPDLRVVPIMLDETELPALVQPRLGVPTEETHPVHRVAMKLLDLRGERDFRLAVQQTLEAAGLDLREFWGAGTFVCCPKCGASPDRLAGWQDIDHDNDRSYAGARCLDCGWNDGSEM